VVTGLMFLAGLRIGNGRGKSLGLPDQVYNLTATFHALEPIYEEYPFCCIARIIFLTACSPASTPQPAITLQPTDTATPLPTPIMEPISMLIPTATITSTPTPDYSLIKFDSIYFNGTTQTVFVFTLNGVAGEFRAVGNNDQYECKRTPDIPDKLYCSGSYQAPGREMVSVYSKPIAPTQS
jgi:hypothetical protein